MNVYLVNDCSVWPGWNNGKDITHHGCAAIIESLTHRIESVGHKIVAVCKRPDGPTRENIEKCDMLIVNGEGTFRDYDKNHEPGRLDRLITGMELAKKMGKRVYLTNAVWCNMGDRWQHFLQSLDGISCREPESAEYIYQCSGVMPEVHPDESYFCEVKTTETWIPHNIGVRGDFYPNNTKGISPDTSKAISGWPKVGLFDYSWHEVVSVLGKADIYATGQHHGVYAACKARTPFAALRVNTHKLTSLFKWAGVKIPLVNDVKSLQEAITFAFVRSDEFIKLFDFLEKQTPWTIPA